MNFYKLNNSVDPNVTGHVPMQIEDWVEEGYNYLAPYSYRNIPSSGRIEYEVRFPIFKLRNEAKQTDFLQNVHASDRIRLLSPKAKEVLEKYSLDATQWYPIKVLHRNRKLNYFVLYMPNDRQSGFINWKASSFAIVHRNEYNFDRGMMSPKEIAPLALSNYKEYILKVRALRETALKVHPQKIILASHIEYDLFRMKVPFMGYFCSVHLKTAIEEAGLTGFRFEPVHG